MGARTRGIANNILSDGLDATDGLSGALSSSNITNASVTNVTSTPSIGGGFEKVASDPPAPTEGDIWYNTTSNTVKGYVLSLTPASWASGGNMNVTRRAGGSAGTQTASVFFGGYNGSNTVNTQEHYNGTSWAGGASLNTPVFLNAGVGTATATLTSGGYALPGGPYGVDGIAYTAESDGSTWTTANNNPVLGYSKGAFGIQTAALVFGGNGSPTNPGTFNSSQQYDGTNWTAGGTLSNARSSAGSGGTLTAGVTYGGSPPAIGGSTEEYNGTSWTTGGTMNAGRTSFYGNNGTQTGSLASGGTIPPAYVNNVELYDGATWTAQPTISTARAGNSSGDSLNGLLAGGYTGTANTNVTEEFTGSTNVAEVKTLG